MASAQMFREVFLPLPESQRRKSSGVQLSHAAPQPGVYSGAHHGALHRASKKLAQQQSRILARSDAQAKGRADAHQFQVNLKNQLAKQTSTSHEMVAAAAAAENCNGVPNGVVEPGITVDSAKFDRTVDIPDRAQIFGSTIPRVEQQFDQIELWSPSVAIIENKGEFLLQADLPGVDISDVSVDVDQQHRFVIISGQRRTVTAAAVEDPLNNIIHQQEAQRSQIYFTRSFLIPCSADSTAIRASYEHDVLTIILPKIDSVDHPLTHINIVSVQSQPASVAATTATTPANSNEATSPLACSAPNEASLPASTNATAPAERE